MLDSGAGRWADAEEAMMTGMPNHFPLLTQNSSKVLADFGHCLVQRK
jgi:hypothetical protein